MTLSLRGNMIGARGGKEVAAMLTENPYIAVVDVAENSLQSSGITAFALLFTGPHSRLEDLDLGRNNFLDMDSEMFAKSLHQDQSLLKLTYVSTGESGRVLWISQRRRSRALCGLL